MGMCIKWKFSRIHLHKSFPVIWLRKGFFQKSHFRSRSEFWISFWLLVPRIHVAVDWSVQCGPEVRHCHYWNALGNWSSVLIAVLPAPKYRAMGRKCVSSMLSANLWLSRLSSTTLWRSFAWWHLSMIELSDLQNQDLLTQEKKKPKWNYSSGSKKWSLKIMRRLNFFKTRIPSVCMNFFKNHLIKIQKEIPHSINIRGTRYISIF